ncbi:DUF5946 family protein [Spirochaeta lutea]|uniref:DUF5946 family protein n=1 Tax=Spirochaeta lutea TaxID=1480694 RepID=UPI00056B432A|nr:DUF5946 family protein [Spirochaeta lutea]
MGTVLDQWDDRFHRILGVEYGDPEYFRVHHLLVLTYMIQTHSYSPEAFPEAVGLLKGFLAGESPQNVRKTEKTSKLLDSSQRTWRARRADDERRGDVFPWSMTIMDVRIDSAREYCGDVVRWARDVRDVLVAAGF